MNFSLDSELKKKIILHMSSGQHILFIISYYNSEFLLPDDDKNVSVIFLFDIDSTLQEIVWLSCV